MRTSGALAWHTHSPVLEGDRALTGFQAALIGSMGFLLAAMNGVPLAWSSLPFVIAISALLILQRNPKVIVRHAFAGPMRPMTLALLALAGISMISAIASGEMESIGEALLRTVAPLLPLFALAGVKIRARHIEWIIYGFVAGAGLLLLRGTFAFYSEWGLPNLSTVLWARYDQFRMAGYMDATLGNLSHLGLYIILVAPLLIALVAYFRVGRALAWAIALVLLLCLVNAVISGSRTAIVLIIPTTALIYARRGANALIVFFIIVAAIWLTLAVQVWRVRRVCGGVQKPATSRA